MKKRFALCAVFLALIFFVFSGCDIRYAKAKRSVFEFGTFVTLKVWGTDSADLSRALDECCARLTEIDDMFSAGDPASELYRLNGAAASEPFPVSDEMFRVIDFTMDYCQKTNGNLDIALGKLIDLWGIGTESAKLPSESEISELLGVSYKQIILDSEKKTVFFSDENVKINLGAVLKGYASEELAKILSRYEITGALLDLGGNITALGTKSSGEGFTVGVTDPVSSSALALTAEMTDATAVTSGSYQRFFEANGKIYHHIFDSSTGYPADSGLASVTVFSKSEDDNLFSADCLSTALFIMGKEKGLDFIENCPDFECVFIENDGKITMSSGMENYRVKF